MADRISELRLTAFKSFRDVVLPLAPLTMLIGRNGSGKSNVLDALEVLSRLTKGIEIRDALDGTSRDAGPVRGGVDGCPPTDWTPSSSASPSCRPVRARFGSMSESRYGLKCR